MWKTTPQLLAAGPQAYFNLAQEQSTDFTIPIHA